jgi:hypothetical protein
MEDAKTTTRRRGEDDRRPAFVVRAPDPDSRSTGSRLAFLGVCGEGKDGLSVKLHSVPVGHNWNGAVIPLPPYE